MEPTAWTFGLNELVRLLFALIIGGLIGIERELRYKAAGLRTMILITMGSALFTMFSARIGASTEPGRIAAQIVTGVGFIGAGVILHQGIEVRGITTASTIWLTAALGIGIGAGYLVLSSVAAALVLLVLGTLPWLEERLGRSRVMRTYEVTARGGHDRRGQLETAFRQCGLHVHCVSQGKRGDEVLLSWQVTGPLPGHERAVELLSNAPEVVAFRH